MKLNPHLMHNERQEKQRLLDYTFVLDASGSMARDIPEVRAELNAQLEALKMSFKENQRPCRVSIVRFDNTFEVLRDAEPIEKLSLVEHHEYRSGGLTALYDAIGVAVKRADARVGYEVKQKEAQALVVIFTDGHENASQEYGGSEIQSLIQEYQSLEGWEIAMVGTDINAIRDMGRRQMRAKSMRHYQAHQKKEAMSNITASVVDYYAEKDECFSLSKEAYPPKPKRGQHKE